MRERSSWLSRTLSYSGRKRGGAGVSGSAKEPVGYVEELAAALVAERAQLRAQPVEHGLEAGDA